jgi:hypothetical protein
VAGVFSVIQPLTARPSTRSAIGKETNTRTCLSVAAQTVKIGRKRSREREGDAPSIGLQLREICSKLRNNKMETYYIIQCESDGKWYNVVYGEDKKFEDKTQALVTFSDAKLFWPETKLRLIERKEQTIAQNE